MVFYTFPDILLVFSRILQFQVCIWLLRYYEPPQEASTKSCCTILCNMGAPYKAILLSIHLYSSEDMPRRQKANYTRLLKGTKVELEVVVAVDLVEVEAEAEAEA